MKHNLDKAVPPYEKKVVNKKSVFSTNFKHIQKKAGVYLIYNDKKLVYVGHSKSDLYKTMYRHFQQWNDKHIQKRVTYSKHFATWDKPKYIVRVIICSAQEAPQLERTLILKHKPKDNPIKYSGYQLTKKDVQVYDSYSKYTAPIIFLEGKNKADEKVKKAILKHEAEDKQKKAGLLKKKTVTKSKLNSSLLTHIRKRKARPSKLKVAKPKRIETKYRQPKKETWEDVPEDIYWEGVEEHVTQYHTTTPMRTKKRK